MKKILFFLTLTVSLFADIINPSNINVLYALDIEDSFILNPKLREMYNDFITKKKYFFTKTLKNGYELIPIIQKEIKQNTLPEELISVAMAESYFMLDAKSHKKAKGLWQFMPKTAKKYGLKIDEYVDERLDPVKSTKAAIKYLEYLHRFFGKWYLAVMAYNAGEARVIEALTRAKVDKLCESMGKECKNNPKIKEYRKKIKEYQLRGRKSYLKLYDVFKQVKNVPVSLEYLLKFQPGLDRQYLPKETRNYIIKILSLSFLFNSDDFIKFSNSYLLNTGTSFKYHPVKVNSSVSLYYLAKRLKTDYESLRNHNLHLKYPFTPPYKYYVYIPYEKLALYKSSKFPKHKYFFVYKVKRGDSLIKIAKTFGLKVSVIKGYNKLGKYLKVGQKIFLPLSVRYVKYKVKNGDSVYKLAKKFGVSYKKILKVNNIKNNVIRVGEIIKIPQRL